MKLKDILHGITPKNFFIFLAGAFVGGVMILFFITLHHEMRELKSSHGYKGKMMRNNNGYCRDVKTGHQIPCQTNPYKQLNDTCPSDVAGDLDCNGISDIDQR